MQIQDAASVLDVTVRNEKDAVDTEVLILGAGATALTVARCLKQAGIRTTVVSFPNRILIATYSRSCSSIASPYALNEDNELCSWLLESFRSNGQKVLLPENDMAALFIAKWSTRLKARFLTWENTLDSLMNLVSKDKLMAQADLAGISVPASICSDDSNDISRWAKEVSGPYFVKPLYSGAPKSSLRGEKRKNWIIETEQALLELVSESDGASYIVQKRLSAGDGNVFDCYGLCDSKGRIISSATHARIRQWIPDRGVTSYGEIPALDPRFSQDELVANTERLFQNFPYHGIFGVEWVWDEITEKLYMVDVNARPFSSIGHLFTCGINLPALAILELLKVEIVKSDEKALKHKFWIDFSQDLYSAAAHIKSGNLTVRKWIGEIYRARSYAYFDLTDPLPMMVVFFRLARGWMGAILRRVKLVLSKPFE